MMMPDGAVSVDFFFPVKFCFIPAGSVRFFPEFPEKILESIAGMAIATNIMKTDSYDDIMMVQLVRIFSSRPHFNDFFPHELY